ncbi:MAG: hypothetical protein QNJ58_15040, partial [Desulfobacterales bacterium]|nr:hypothetical protein [Desulfobacterales bacterium]
HQFNLPGPPGLLEPRFERAVEAQDGEPAFAGDGLDPVVFFSLLLNIPKNSSIIKIRLCLCA